VVDLQVVSTGRRVAIAPWSVFLVAGAALTAGYFAMPRASLSQSAYSNVVSLAFIGAILVGLRIHRPTDRGMWVWFAVGMLMSILADGVLTGYLAVSGETPFPSLADVLYLAAYPVLFLAVARLGRSAGTYRARERRLDALIVALGVLVLTWQPLMHAYAGDATQTMWAKSTLLAYPIMDIGLLYFVLAAVVFAGRRDLASLLVGGSIAVMLVGDFGYDLLELHSAYTSGDLIDVTWLLSYLLLGVAALHPSMARTEVGPAVTTPRVWWLVIVAMASFLPTAYLFYGLALGKDLDFVPLAGLALVMAMLAITRMGWMFQALRQRANQLQLRSTELQTRTTALQEALQERDLLEHDLRHQAFHDPLTGLANRALLEDRLEHALARSAREHDLVALLICDLDGFKTVNDSLGHQVGDALLVTTAARLSEAVRPGDTVARLGGDEFAILLDGVRDREIAAKVAERIVSQLREPADVGADAVIVSASVGVSVGSAYTGAGAAGLISDADTAMYEAKTQGRNRYVSFESAMRSRVMERLRFTTAFAGALAHGEFYLDYQPCFSLTGGRLQSFEALLRWNHPQLGVVAPMRFIPLAEETGFILELGRWILTAACQQAATWPATPDGSPYLAVNVSARQLTHQSFAADVRRALNASGLPGTRLVLEVTESMLISETVHTINVLGQLKDIGVRIAIDDFGVGYSSLSQLHNLPVDFVKIDKSFVDGIGTGTDPDKEAEGRAVIETILRLAHNLDLTTVAEGIEIKSQRDALTEMGCNSGQGFLLSVPLDPTAAATLARRALIKACA
jgi:diguanylate cyclase